MNVPAIGVSRSLISERFPDAGIAVERLELGPADFLEKRSSLDGFERCYLIVLFSIGELRAVRAVRTVKGHDTFSEHFGDRGIGLAVRVENFDHLQVA